jgi:hypothetical protein
MRTTLYFAALFGSIIVRAPAAEFVLVSEGRPRAGILLAEREATGPLLFAVRELERYVKGMSGASLPVVLAANLDAQAAGDLPGTILVTADAAAAQRTGAGLNSPGSEDHYLLQVTEKRIAIVGASPRAALFATYDLLERLGCGWCVPGDDTVPQRRTLALSELEVETAPAFQYRMLLDFPLKSVAQSIAIVDWIAKNRMNWVHPCPNAMGEPAQWYERRERVVPEIRKRGLQLIFGGHTMHTWLPPERFEEHPGWFAHDGGERKPPTLCVTNEEMTAELVRNLRRFLDRCPEVQVVDLWHPDGDVFCHCPVCTQGLVPAAAGGRIPEGTPPDAVRSAYVISYVRFLNRVASAIAESHPRIMVSPLIYGPVDHARPDGCPPLADNLLLGLAHISRDSFVPLAGAQATERNLRYLGNDLTWMAASRHHYLYEYYNAWVAPFIYPGAQVIARDLQVYRELGAQGASSDLYGYSPCNMYVAARALWSSGLSWEAAARDFHLRYYGEAGTEMAEDWVALEKGVQGKLGYQSGGASNEPGKRKPCGEWFNEIRPREIRFLEGLIARTGDPVVKARLERALKPWKLWNADARWWAFPPFEADG